MASEIRVNKINSRTGVGTITLSPTGVDFTGIATVATLKATTGIVTTLSVTGDVDIADKIVHTGDTNTAIRFPAADTFTVETSGSERLRITSAGDVGISTASPDRQLHVLSSNGTVAHFESDNVNTVSQIVFQGKDISTPPNLGATGEDLHFTTNNLERVRINSAGKFGVGTNSNLSGLLTLHQNDDQLFLKQTDGDSGFLLGSNNTNGNLNLKRRSVGSNTTIATFRAAGGLTFNGDTAAANALDDYEEGTFTATCDNSVTLHSDTNLLQYVKIGSSVTVMGQIRVNSSNSGSSLTINNLPFTVYSSGEASAYAVGAVRLYSADMASDHKYVVAICDGGSTNLTFQGVRDNNTSQGLGATDNGYYMFSVTYRTTT